jgi:P2 family phage contractile tail tube protein
MFPEQTIAFRVYKNSKSLLGVATVEMPQIDYLTETISGSGIAGEYESPAIGITGPMTAKFSWISQTRDFFYLLDQGQGNQLELRASQQKADPTTGLKSSQGLRISMVAAPKSAPLGSLETGKKQGNETEMEVTRIRIELDGKEVLLIDKLNFIHRVNGDDHLLPVRSDLGMEN